VATVGSWTLSPTAGDNTLTATSGSLSGSPVTFTATGTAGAAATIARNAGGTSATAGTAVSPPPSVIVKDANGNPVANVAVTFTPAAGSGTVTPTTPVNTGADGIAALTSWTLSPTAGTNTLTATASGLTGSPVTFTATGTAGAAATIAPNAGGTSAPAGTAVSPPPSVIVTDANGNPVAQVAVTFSVTPGNGTITGASQTTNASGVATVGSWTLSPTAGENTLTATSGSLSGSPVTFTATGTAGAAATIVANSATSQSATAGTAVSTPPSVIVKDANGNPVTGVAVTFSPAAGSGTVTPTTPVSTGSDGIAALTSWTLSPTAGSNTLTAASGSLSGSPVTFTATGTAGAAATIAPNGGGTSAPAGTAVSPPPSVIVKDANGNPVEGVAVTFTPAAGSGTVTPTTPVSTGSDGIAALTSWTLSPTAGTNTLTATSGTLSGSPVTFTATGTAGAATKLALTTAPSNSAQSGVAFTQQPVVQLQDVNGNAVSETGTGVTAVVATGPAGATLANATATTGGTGAASFSGLAISGPVGSYTLRFESGTLTAATSETIALSAAATTTTIITHTPDPSTVGQAIRVTFSVTSNTGTPTGNVTVTDGTDSCVGTVAAGTCDLTLTTAGARTLTATYAGDANFASSTSAGVGHTVTQAATTTTITGVTPEPSLVGQAVTVAFSVTSSGGVPTGDVTVSDGTLSCTGTVAAGSCSVTPLTPGPETFVATYAGDANFLGSTSAPVTHTVNLAPGPTSSR